MTIHEQLEVGDSLLRYFGNINSFYVNYSFDSCRNMSIEEDLDKYIDHIECFNENTTKYIQTENLCRICVERGEEKLFDEFENERLLLEKKLGNLEEEISKRKNDITGKIIFHYGHSTCGHGIWIN